MAKGAPMSADTLADRIRERAAKEAIRLSDLITCTHEGCNTINILRANIMRLGAEVLSDFALSELSAAEQWKTEVIDALVVNNIYVEAHETDPCKALRDLISWEAKIALDPKVSKEANDFEEAARKEEREECAKIAEECNGQVWGSNIAAAIRNRE